MRTLAALSVLALLAAPALALGGDGWVHEKQAPGVSAVTGKAICYFVQNNGALTAGGT